MPSRGTDARMISPMVDRGALVAFALVAFGMVCSPGPNMLYLISRSVTQGRTAGVISLGGVALGFVDYTACNAGSWLPS